MNIHINMLHIHNNDEIRKPFKSNRKSENTA